MRPGNYVAPTTAHLKYMKDLKDALMINQKGPNPLPFNEILAVTAQYVGQLLAIQDQTLFTKDALMNLIANNIEIGNQAAVQMIVGNTAGNA